MFPDADIKGCAFHWGQAVMRKVANLGLKTSYNEKKGVHFFVRKLLYGRFGCVMVSVLTYSMVDLVV